MADIVHNFSLFCRKGGGGRGARRKKEKESEKKTVKEKNGKHVIYG